MYETIVERLVNESRKIHKRSVTNEKQNQVKRCAQKISKPINETIMNEKIKDTNKPIIPNRSIPIGKPINNSRFPTKQVDFESDIQWL